MDKETIYLRQQVEHTGDNLRRKEQQHEAVRLQL